MTTPAITAVHTAGNGPALVLGPSLGTSTALWEPALPYLTQDFDVYAWDLPGHGESPAASAPFTIADLADAVIRRADEAGIDQFFYAGVSLGGAVGLELALNYPTRLHGLAVICSAAKIGAVEAWHERAQAVRSLGTPHLVVPSATRWFAPGSIEAHPEITSRLLHDLSNADDRSYAFACEALAGFDVRDRLGEIRTPVIAIAGLHDEVSPFRELEAISVAVQRGEVAEVVGASHLAPAEKPAEVATLLRDFFLKEH
ncbi:MAG: alpha/beta fold hydrolase [Microbacteriaceae bacterium]